MNSKIEFDLTGKVALVTGAARGIGAGIAHSLARAGAHVVVNDLHPEADDTVAGAIIAAGGSAIYLQADVSDEASVQALVESAVQWKGRIDVLVCSAGITDAETIFTLTSEKWDRVLRTNLTGTFLCAKYCMTRMKEQEHGGRIIFIGSGVAHQGALLGHSAYAASKGAIHSLARTLARTGAPLHITVNVIAPGSTDTDLFRETHSADYVESVRASIPLGLASPADIGAAAVFLASNAAQHITGITLDVNGGQIIR
jgi:3-oxoacyl-[acyl-carrier protein] reductase